MKKSDQLIQLEIEDHERQVAGIHPQVEGVDIKLPPTVDSNGDPIIYTGEPGREIPPNGPVSQSSIYQWLGESPRKGSLKDYPAAFNMIQRVPSSHHKYQWWKGAAWGQPMYYTTNGVGQSYQSWDRRFDGNQISLNQWQVAATVGAGSLYWEASTGYGATPATQSSFGCNGYFYGGPGNYRVEFNYEAYVTSKGSGFAQDPLDSFLAFGLYGYPNGYLNDISQRVEVIKYTDLIPTNVVTAGYFDKTGYCPAGKGHMSPVLNAVFRNDLEVANLAWCRIGVMKITRVS